MAKTSAVSSVLHQAACDLTMFTRTKRLRPRDAGQTRASYGLDAAAGGNIQDRIAKLRSVPREGLADAVFMLAMSAREQFEQIRRAIRERAQVIFDCDPQPHRDLSTYLAEDAVSTLRHQAGTMPKCINVFRGLTPNVRFTVQQEEAVSLLAAMIREQRLEGILEGLRLAGVLNESPKGRHSGCGV